MYYIYIFLYLLYYIYYFYYIILYILYIYYIYYIYYIIYITFIIFVRVHVYVLRSLNATYHEEHFPQTVSNLIAHSRMMNLHTYLVSYKTLWYLPRARRRIFVQRAKRAKANRSLKIFMEFLWDRSAHWLNEDARNALANAWSLSIWR